MFIKLEVFIILRSACLALYKTEKAREINIKINLKPVNCHVMKLMESCQKNILWKVLVSPVHVIKHQMSDVRTLWYFSYLYVLLAVQRTSYRHMTIIWCFALSLTTLRPASWNIDFLEKLTPINRHIRRLQLSHSHNGPPCYNFLSHLDSIPLTRGNFVRFSRPWLPFPSKRTNFSLPPPQTTHPDFIQIVIPDNGCRL